MKKMNRKGFTIVELVIVIAVIAILAAVLIPTFSGIVDKAKESAALQEVLNAYKAQLAVELSTADTTDDVVYGAGQIVVEHDGKIIGISANGEATVGNTEEPNFTLTDGVFELIDNDEDDETPPAEGDQTP